MVDELMVKYQDDYKEAIKDANDAMEDKLMLEEDEEVERDINLPSIKDSKLWSVKVIPGKERELVFKITNKLIQFVKDQHASAEVNLHFNRPGGLR